MSDSLVARILNARVYDVARETALELAPRLSARLQSRVWLKREDLQSIFSFKLRGAYNKIALLSPERAARGVIAASAGNHAQGVASHAQRLGIPSTIVMPVGTPFNKIRRTEAFGARVILEGDTLNAAEPLAHTMAEADGLTFVHPYDDEEIMAGQGTVGLEMLEDVADLDVIIVPIGGGGLISGCAQIVKLIKPDIKVIGVEMALAPAMKRSIEAGRLVTLDSVPIIIDGLAVKTVGAYNFEICKAFVDDIVTVDEKKIFAAIPWIMERCKLVAEGAAASTVAALLTEAIRPAAGSKVACVLSGGNLNLSALQNMTWN